MAKTLQLTAADQASLLEAGVGLAVVFGSYVTGQRHPGSDVDIGILFADFKHKETDPVGTYGMLTDIFSRFFPDQKLDFVYLHEAPLSLQYRAAMEGRLVFATSPALAANFKEYAMKMYYDFKPVEEEFERAIFG